MALLSEFMSFIVGKQWVGIMCGYRLQGVEGAKKLLITSSLVYYGMKCGMATCP